MSTKTIARLGLMLALIVALTAAEQALPPVPWLPPGVKPGLSHIVIMYCVFHIGKGQAVLLGILKSLFVLLTRGLLAASLSLAGGMLSLALLITLLILFSRRITYTTAAVSGAVAHNVAQLGVYSLISQVNLLFFYLPLLLVSGIAAGLATGTLLKLTAPLLKQQ